MSLNCIIVEDDKVSVKLLQKLLEGFDFVELVGVCEDAISASKVLFNEQVDIIFLDIEMPGMSGIEFIESLKGDGPQIIIISAKEEYALKAFEKQVADYILKPVTSERLLKAINRATELHKARKELKPEINYIFVKDKSSLFKINYQDILFIESMGDYLGFHTDHKRYVILSTMKDAERKLPANFVRVHRSYMINIDKIDRVEDDLITIRDKAIPLSRSFKKEFMEKVNVI